MARRTATIGIDVGTSATKGVLVAEDGRVLASATSAYPLLTPQPGWTEQHPEDWWRAATDVLRQLTATPDVEVVAVGLSGQMHGSVFLDRDGRVLRPALLWNDARTGAECREIARRVGAERLIAITGNAANAGFQAPKVLWLRAHEPDAYAALARVLLPKDFIRFRLTGEAATDASDASGTLLLDLAARRYSDEILAAPPIPPACPAPRPYSDEILAALDIPASWLQAMRGSADVPGRVSDEAAAATGLGA